MLDSRESNCRSHSDRGLRGKSLRTMMSRISNRRFQVALAMHFCTCRDRPTTAPWTPEMRKALEGHQDLSQSVILDVANWKVCDSKSHLGGYSSRANFQAQQGHLSTNPVIGSTVLFHHAVLAEESSNLIAQFLILVIRFLVRCPNGRFRMDRCQGCFHFALV